jgi:uncharacterized membrane protein
MLTSALGAARIRSAQGDHDGRPLQRKDAMIKRTLTIASLAGVLGLGLAAASPANAAGPWGIAANGTQLNGIALEGVA